MMVIRTPTRRLDDSVLADAILPEFLPSHRQNTLRICSKALRRRPAIQQHMGCVEPLHL